MFRTKKRIAELEEENESLQDELEEWKEKCGDKNIALRNILATIQTFKKKNTYGEAGYRDLVRQINDIAVDNIEKKLSDEIFPYFTSNS